MKVAAMIPARSESKGIPDKNIKELCGRPLIDYSIKAALGCKKIEKVFLNSDSEAYLQLGHKLGAQPFLRPKDLALDDTPMNSVVINFAEVLEQEGEAFDAIVVLYPVYPLRNSADLTRAITEFEGLGGNRPLVGMKRPDTHPYLCYKLDNKHSPKPVIDFDANVYYRRQTYPKYFEITYWTCVLPAKSLNTLNAYLMNEHVYGYMIPDNVYVVDVDTPLDFQYVEFLIQKGIHTLS